MANMSHISTNSPHAWILAARPKTLTGAAVPVMIGISAAWADGFFRPVPALLCLRFPERVGRREASRSETRLCRRLDYIACHAPGNHLYHAPLLPHRLAVGVVRRMDDGAHRGMLCGVLFPLYHLHGPPRVGRPPRTGVFRSRSGGCHVLSAERYGRCLWPAAW